MILKYLLARLPLDMRSVSREKPVHIVYIFALSICLFKIRKNIRKMRMFFNLHYIQNIDLFTSRKYALFFA